MVHSALCAVIDLGAFSATWVAGLADERVGLASISERGREEALGTVFRTRARRYRRGRRVIVNCV